MIGGKSFNDIFYLLPGENLPVQVAEEINHRAHGEHRDKELKEYDTCFLAHLLIDYQLDSLFSENSIIAIQTTVRLKFTC